MSDMRTHAETLIAKAAKADANDAMKYSQAAVNVANAIFTLKQSL